MGYFYLLKGPVSSCNIIDVLVKIVALPSDLFPPLSYFLIQPCHLFPLRGGEMVACLSLWFLYRPLSWHWDWSRWWSGGLQLLMSLVLTLISSNIKLKFSSLWASINCFDLSSSCCSCMHSEEAWLDVGTTRTFLLDLSRAICKLFFLTMSCSCANFINCYAI